MFSDENLTDDKFLGGKVSLLQPKNGYRAGTDPVLLAAACPAKTGQSVLELGCGVGTSLICLNARVKVVATGVEALPEYAALARQNAERNGFEMNITTANLTAMPLELRDKIFDHTLINPPFFRNGRKAHDGGRANGRQEDTPLSDWIDHALRRTKPKGYVTIIHLTERLADIIACLTPRSGDIEIKPLSSREKSLPKRIIIRARKGASGGASLYNPLILHEGASHLTDKDSFTPEVKEILRDGRLICF